MSGGGEGAAVDAVEGRWFDFDAGAESHAMEPLEFARRPKGLGLRIVVAVALAAH